MMDDNPKGRNVDWRPLVSLGPKIGGAGFFLEPPAHGLRVDI